MTQASPTKLRDGSWGATVKGSVTPGEQITITARSGKSWTARVSRVIWRGDGMTIVATGQERSFLGQSQRRAENTYRTRYGWDGVRGSASYYSSGMYDEES